MRKPKFKVGQKVRIIARLAGHQFEIGEICTIERVNGPGDYTVRNGTAFWWLGDDEMEAA